MCFLGLLIDQSPDRPISLSDRPISQMYLLSTFRHERPDTHTNKLYVDMFIYVCEGHNARLPPKKCLILYAHIHARYEYLQVYMHIQTLKYINACIHAHYEIC
jgi:hypothetical protein